MIDGLLKNTFALMDFTVFWTLIGIGTVVLLSILPPWGVLFGEGFARLLFLAAMSLRIFLSVHCCKSMKISTLNVVGMLISPYINCYVALKSAYLTVKNGGICWRGTEYFLEKLKLGESILSRIYGKE